MNIRKLCRPVLVETKEKSRICHLTAKGKEFNDLRYLDVEAPIILDSINYILILISLDSDDRIENGKIKVGEIYYDGHGNTRKFGTGNCFNIDSKKIIATQSQLPTEYIQQFIEEYNKNEVKDVIVEMEENIAEYVGPFNRDAKQYELKLTNGLVTIIKKDSCDKCTEDCKKTSTMNGEFGSCVNFNDLIHETIDDTSDDNISKIINLKNFLEYEIKSTKTNLSAVGSLADTQYYKGKITGFTHALQKLNETPKILYTEEDVYKLFNKFREDFSLYRGIQILDNMLNDWFIVNKKK
jgi:hypothetical protein